MKTVLQIFLIAVTTCCANAQLLTTPTPTWKTTFKVVDESGQPVPNAKASVGYLDTHQITGLTDSNGIFVASHKDKSFGLAFDVKKAGYYSFHQSYEMGWAYQYNATKWDPTIKVLLRKIGKPIPMYARNARIEIPEINKPIGFDLIKNDWVAPYGKGKQSDFIFTAQRRWIDWKDFDSSFSLSFSHSGDGLIPVLIPLSQGSELRMSAIAPVEGYTTNIVKSLSDTPTGGWKHNDREANKDLNYYFRVRTEMDDQGNVTNALYGKIYGDFALDPINSKTLLVFFNFYFNPNSNSRNVEFDPKRNLSQNLKLLEGVNAP